MKRLLCFLAVVFVSMGLFAAPKITEKQVEDFITGGKYIKIVVYSDNEYCYTSFYNKDLMFEVFVSDNELRVYNDKKEIRKTFLMKECEVSFEGSNIVLAYHY